MFCPICNKPSQLAFRPFCCKRCADVDLGKWFGGNYTLASDEPLDEEAIEQVIETLEQ